jgi:hypothetical protein
MPVNSSPFSIDIVRPDEEQVALAELIDLLQDTVESGASVGFLPPLNIEEARQYWSSVFRDVACQTCVLIVARDAGRIVGSVQLALHKQTKMLQCSEIFPFEN